MTIMEVNNKDFSSCEDLVEEFEPGHINRLVEVLQA